MSRSCTQDLSAAVSSAQSDIRAAQSVKDVVSALQRLIEAIGESRETAGLFSSRHHHTVAKLLLDSVVVDWMSGLTEVQKASLCDIFFTDKFCRITDVLVTIFSVLSAKRHSFVSSYLKERFDAIVFSGCFGVLLKEVSIQKIGTNNDDLIQALVSMPDKFLNIFQGKLGWTPEEYFAALVKEITDWSNVKTSTPREQMCSALFVAQMLGKIVAHGYSLIASRYILHYLQAYGDEHDAQLFYKRICAVPNTAIEQFCEKLFQEVTRRKSHKLRHIVCKVFEGECDNRSSRFRLLVTHKFLMVRWYSKDLFVDIIATILAQSQPNVATQRPLLIDVLMTLIDVWGDPSSVNGGYYPQQLYICKSVVILLLHLEEEVRTTYRQTILTKVVSSLRPYLDSSIRETRDIGLATGQILTHILEPNHTLTFSVHQTPDVVSLQSLKNDFEIAQEVDDEKENDAHRPAIIKSTYTKNNEDVVAPFKVTVGFDAEGDDPDAPFDPSHCESPVSDSDDDDDDLEPFEMGPEAEKLKVPPPVYLRDCVEGLRATDDFDKFSASLLAVEGLVRKVPGELSEMAEELLRILLHSENVFNQDDFLVLRRDAMVATAVLSPAEAARYLTTQFYGENYNLRQRLDVLDVLGRAAMELSSILPASPESLTQPNQIAKSSCDPSSRLEAARREIDERVKAKTRIFSTASKVKHPVPQANRFAPHAGAFFYPLLQSYDRPIGTLNLLQGDNLVLSALIRTLGAIVSCSGSAFGTSAMASAMLEFMTPFRFHKDPSVRQAVLFALALMLKAIPAKRIAEFSPELQEFLKWLQFSFEHDADEQCRKLSGVCLYAVHNGIQ